MKKRIKLTNEAIGSSLVTFQEPRKTFTKNAVNGHANCRLLAKDVEHTFLTFIGYIYSFKKSLFNEFVFGCLSSGFKLFQHLVYFFVKLLGKGSVPLPGFFFLCCAIMFNNFMEYHLSVLVVSWI